MTLSPPFVLKGHGELSPWTTATGKFPPIPVNRISNKAAARTITDKTLPTKVLRASDFMRLCVGTGYASMNAKGVHGEVFSISNMSKLKELHDSLLQNVITGVRPDAIPSSTEVVMKVIAVRKRDRVAWEPHRVNKLDSNRGDISELWNKAEHLQKSEQRIVWRTLLLDGATDASNHHYLSTEAPTTVIPAAGGTISLSCADVVPKFYFAGSSVRYGVYVIVMGVAKGTSLANMDSITPRTIANLEKAVLTLSVAGIEHGDLHTGNIMVHGDSVKLIDFGMTAILPIKYRSHAAKWVTAAVATLFKTRSWPEDVANSVWYDPENGTLRYMNSYMHQDVSWYNPSGKLIKYMKTHVPKIVLDAARYTIWSSSKIKSRSTSPMSVLMKPLRAMRFA